MKLLPLLLLCSTVAHAQFTLTYSGDTAGSIVLSAPLVNGTQTVTPVSFDFAPILLNSAFSDYMNGSGHATPGTATSTFQFTVANGAITGWDMELFAVSGVYANQQTRELASLSSVGDTVTSTVCDGTCVQTVTHGTGGWSTVQTAKAAPELDSSSLGSALTLLAGGLLVIRSGKRLKT